MDKVLKDRLQEALDVLEMKPNASRAMIQSRARRLKANYQDTDKKAQEKLETITLAETFILDHIEYLKALDNDNEATKDVDKYAIFKNKQTKKKEKKPINFKMITISVIIFLIVSAAAVTFINIRNNREVTYEELTTVMQNFTNGKSERFERLINDLPEGYKDSQTFKVQYQDIMVHIDVLESSDVVYDYTAMQAAYYELATISSTHDDWDLSEYLSRINDVLLILGVRWENADYYFYLDVNSDESSEYYGWYVLETTVPNDKNPEKDYFFFQTDEFVSLGFVNQINKYDRFIAYRLLSVKESEITLYTYKTLEQVTLYHPTKSSETVN